MSDTMKWVDGEMVPMSPEDIAQMEADRESPPAVPQSITRRQALLALLQAGLLDDVEAAVAEADRAVQIEWQHASVFERSHPLLLGIAARLDPPLTEEQVDDLFRAAAAI